MTATVSYMYHVAQISSAEVLVMNKHAFSCLLVGYSARCIILKEGLIYMQLKEKNEI